jgi:undecaprenyl diphosphate synthase
MHVAIIMNGNARWASKRGLPLAAAHRTGAAALRTTVELALRAGIKTLTLYGIGSADSEGVLEGYLRSDSKRCEEQAVRISVIGNPLRVGAALLPEWAPAKRSRLHLRIVIDYSAHDRVVKASWCNADPQAPENFVERLREIDQTALPAGAVDLLIRTGGGKCRSDFMLWEVAYARLHVADCLWPDFTAHHFQRALGYSNADEWPAARTS